MFMKSYIKIFLIVIVCLLVFYGCQINPSSMGDSNSEITTETTAETSENMDDKNKIEVLELTDNIKRSFEAMLDFGKDKQSPLEIGGCIRNATTASEIAIAIFCDVFEEDVQEHEFPLQVYYDDDDKYWYIRTAPLPEGWRGGSKYIILNAMNAEVIGVWAFQ